MSECLFCFGMDAKEVNWVRKDLAQDPVFEAQWLFTERKSPPMMIATVLATQRSIFWRDAQEQAYEELAEWSK